MIKVSVIVPVFNTEKYLEKCLNSLVNQTLPEIEIVIVNDGSTDRSTEIIEHFKKCYPEKIRSAIQENSGQGVARNEAIEMCSGEYIGFVDSDDWVEPEMYQRMYEKAQENNADFVECPYSYLRDDGDTYTEIKPYGCVRAYVDKRDMFVHPLVSPWNKLYRAEVIKNNNVRFTEGKIYEDTAFFIKTIPFIERHGFVEEKFVNHILRKTSTMSINRNKKVADIFDVLDDVIDFYCENGLFEEYKERLEFFCTCLLLRSSLSRIVKINDKAMRQEFVVRTWEWIDKKFPEFKKNELLQKGTNGIYIRMTNRYTIHIWTFIFRAKWRLSGG